MDTATDDADDTDTADGATAFRGGVVGIDRGVIESGLRGMGLAGRDVAGRSSLR